MTINPMSIRPVIDLEHVVRPFMSPNTKPERLRDFNSGGGNSSGVNQNSEGEDIPTLEWTARANVDAITLEARGFTVDFSGTINDRDETSRITRTVRVENPDDPAQYVDVEVIDEISFKDPNRKTHRFTLNNEDLE